jgi:hypothetical protein
LLTILIVYPKELAKIIIDETKVILGLDLSQEEAENVTRTHLA